MGSSAIFDAIEKGDALEVKNLAGAESVREFVLEEDGRTPLMVAACCGNGSVFKALVDAGADINVDDKGGRNAFLHAAAEGHVSIVQSILALDDSQVFAATKSGNTGLHRAAAYGHPEVCSALLQAGADIDCVNEEGSTALCRACRWGHADAAIVLLLAGADPCIPDGSGRTPLRWARLKGFSRVEQALLETRPAEDAQLAATANKDRAQDLRERGAAALEEAEDGGLLEGMEDEGETGEEEAEAVRVEGWMAKQGHIIRNWKNRWFILDGRRMFYFAKEGATRPKGVIRLVKGTEVVVEERYNKPYCFTLQTPKKKFILQAANEEEMAEWIDAINTNLEAVAPEEAEAGADADVPEED